MSSARILYGKPVAEKMLGALREEVQKLDPTLVVVQIGDDPASTSYIKQKLKSCAEIGLRAQHKHLDQNTTVKQLMELIHELNDDPDVSGFIVQVPLPPAL